MRQYVILRGCDGTEVEVRAPLAAYLLDKFPGLFTTDDNPVGDISYDTKVIRPKNAKA